MMKKLITRGVAITRLHSHTRRHTPTNVLGMIHTTSTLHKHGDHVEEDVKSIETEGAFSDLMAKGKNSELTFDAIYDSINNGPIDGSGFFWTEAIRLIKDGPRVKRDEKPNRSLYMVSGLRGAKGFKLKVLDNSELCILAHIEGNKDITHCIDLPRGNYLESNPTATFYPKVGLLIVEFVNFKTYSPIKLVDN